MIWASGMKYSYRRKRNKLMNLKWNRRLLSLSIAFRMCMWHLLACRPRILLRGCFMNLVCRSWWGYLSMCKQIKSWTLKGRRMMRRRLMCLGRRGRCILLRIHRMIKYTMLMTLKISRMRRSNVTKLRVNLISSFGRIWIHLWCRSFKGDCSAWWRWVSSSGLPF